MSVKPTYEELEQTVEKLKREVLERDRLKAESLNVLSKAVESSSDAIGMSTAEGHHYYQNQSFDDLFGDIGNDPPRSVYADEKVGREVFETIMGGDPWCGEVEMYKKNGTILNILLRAYPIKDDEGKVIQIVGIHTNLTEQKQTEESLQKAHDELKGKVQKRTEELVRANELLQLEVEERKKTEKELIKSREQLRDLSQYLQSSRERERARIAREVHDDLGQVLTAIKTDVSWLKGKIHKNQKKLIQKAGSTRDLVDLSELLKKSPRN